MNRLILAAALAGVAAAGTAIAQSALPSGKMAHGLLAADTNGDGIVTRAEAIAAADARFARGDTNSDGKLAGDELRGRWAKRAGADGITREAFRARALERFDRADTNHDGRIDQAERAAMKERRAHRRGGPGAMLRMADANRDGIVTRAEATAAAQAMFDRADANRDGRIDHAEMQAMRGAHRGPDGRMPPAGNNR